MLKIEKISSNIEVIEEVLSPTKTRYVLEPLYRGYGHTIGNALRRVLLSSVPGTAVKGVKIEGVVSEFSTIEGIKENVVDIILNIKSLVIKADENEEKVAKLSVKGPAIVTGADIETNGTFEIINKEQIIANITKPVTLNIEFLIDTGEGFVVSDDMDKEQWPVGFLAVDALYSPIVNATYRVEDTMVGRITNFDKLILELETNGSVNTREAISYAIEVITKHFKPLLELGNRMQHLRPVIVEEEAVEEVKDTGIPDLKIEYLDLSVRSYNCLKKSGIDTLKALSKVTVKDLLGIKNLGKGSLNEIINKLREYGIELERNEERL